MGTGEIFFGMLFVRFKHRSIICLDCRTSAHSSRSVTSTCKSLAIKPHHMFSRSDMGSQVLDSQEQGQKARERRGAEGLDMDFSHDPAMKKQKVRIGRDAMYIHHDTEYKACERCGNRHDPRYCESFGEQETQDPPNSDSPLGLKGTWRSRGLREWSFGGSES